MKLTAIFCVLKGHIANEFVRCSRFSPTPLSLKTFMVFGRTANHVASFNFLRKELPVRLANIMQEILLLPDYILETSYVQLVVSLYEKSFCELVDYENKAGDLKTLSMYTDCIANIRDRHANIVETMAQGVMQVKKMHGIAPVGENQLQYFLDRFYLMRISIRMLINQHVAIFGSKLNENLRHIGVIDSSTNVLEIIQDAHNKAGYLCGLYYGASPDLRVVIINKPAHNNDHKVEWHCETKESLNECIASKVIELSYVPTHLYHMMFELMKNAMRATVEYHLDSDSIPPLKVLVCGASENLTIQIFDEGGGIPRSLMDQIFKYTFTTADHCSPGSPGVMNAAPMAGYGYGLPLSRLYARYFNGDLTVNSIEGFGTDAVVYLRRRPAEADELLPIFNKTSARQYTNSGIPAADWSNPHYTSGLHTFAASMHNSDH